MPLGVGAPAGVARAPAHRRAGLAQGAPQCRLLGGPVPSRPSSLVCDVHGGRPPPSLVTARPRLSVQLSLPK